MSGSLHSKNSAAREDLRRSLLMGDLGLADVPPVLLHLMSRSPGVCYCDEVLARVRAITHSLANEILSQSVVDGGPDRQVAASDVVDLTSALRGNRLIICYIHALVVEGYVTTQLFSRFGIASGTSALLEELSQSGDESLSRLALENIAAQTRFMTMYERMELGRADLPGGILSAVLAECENVSPTVLKEGGSVLPMGTPQRLNRLALIDELLAHPLFDQSRALDLAKAGVGLFYSAVAKQSSQDRVLVAICAATGHSARLALTLKSVGADDRLIQRNLALLTSGESFSVDVASLSVPDAAALLSQSGFGQ